MAIDASAEAAVEDVAHRVGHPGPRRRRRVTRRPSSAVSDVTPASAMPHGTIAENAARSQSQFSANPCSVVARATRMPMAAILRAGRALSAGTHTPERPSTRPVCQPELGAHRDQRLLKAPNIIHDIERLGEADDRVADQLAGAVPGDLAAAVGVDHGCAVDGALVRLGAPARGVDRRVLEQQQRVRPAGHPRCRPARAASATPRR